MSFFSAETPSGDILFGKMFHFLFKEFSFAYYNSIVRRDAPRGRRVFPCDFFWGRNMEREMLEIREVKTKRDLRRFVNYPNQLYRDEPNYVPPFRSDDLSDWDRKKNPAFSYCDAKCWLALRDGKIVGRIGAILSRKANEKWGTSRMRFTQVDFIDDAEVSDALFSVVEAYAREMGCAQVQGPLGFSDLDREGMLVEGFERRGMFITYYNAPYYAQHMARLGYEKDVDWLEYLLTVPEKNDPRMVRIRRLAEYVRRHKKLHAVHLKSKRDYPPYVEKFFRLVNDAYAPLYGVVPLTDEQIARYAKKFVPLISEDYLCLVENENGRLVAFGACAPSLAEATKKNRGRLFPVGWIPTLKALKKNDTVDLFLIAVHPDYQGQGINAIILEYFHERFLKNGIRYAETGPQLETNTKIHAQWADFDKEQHKRRRCWIKTLDGTAEPEAKPEEPAHA